MAGLISWQALGPDACARPLRRLLAASIPAARPSPGTDGGARGSPFRPPAPAPGPWLPAPGSVLQALVSVPGFTSSRGPH